MSLQALLKEPISTEELLERLRKRLEPMQEKSEYIRIHMPEYTRQTLENAEAAYKGMLKLPGTGGKKEFVGNPPCWLERRHNDNEFLWQLNRMTHWQDLLEAYSLTQDVKYGLKVIDEMLNWIEVVKIEEEMYAYPIEYFCECNPLRALELGIRNYKIWPLMLEHLGKTELFTEEILEKYLLTVYKQIKILRRVSPVLWPKADHNHFLMECLGILTTALYFPELKEAEEWKNFAIQSIEECARAQLTQEGGQIEGCPSYHNGCMFWFGLAAVLAKRFRFEFTQAYFDLLKKNLDYSIYSLRPTGKCVPVGDSHANHLAIMAGVYGYLAFEDLKWLKLITNVIDTEEIIEEANKHIWRVLEVEKFNKALQSIKGKKFKCEMPTTFWNETLGQAIIRTGWDSEAISFLMTCRSPVQNDHAHIDLLSFDFTALGKNMICDPGIFCYRDDEDRRVFKTTAYHSTIVIDGKDQFEYRGSFSFGPQKIGKVNKVEDKGFYQVASGYHENYQPITHYRHMALVDKKFVIVVDGLTHLQDNKIERYYHLDFTEVEDKGKYVLAKSEKANLQLYSYPKNQVQTLKGRLSDVNDIARTSTRVLYTDKVQGEKSYITLLVPFRGEESPEVSIEHNEEEGCFKVTYNEEHYTVKVINSTFSIEK